MKLNLGSNIRKYRKEKDMTQEGLAEYLGVSPQAVSRWESGVTYPDLEFVPVLANLFGVSTDALFDVEEKQREEAATAALTELARLSHEKELAVERILALIRDIRKHYLGCECFWNFWLSVRHKAYRHEAILPEVRLTFEALMAGNYPIGKKMMAVQQFNLIEDEEHIEAFMREYATESDMSKKKLLYSRYLNRGDLERSYRCRQDILYGYIDELVGNSSLWHGREDIYDPMLAKASTELGIALLHRLCMCIPDETHPISGNGEVDMWVEPRLWMGIHEAAFSAYAGETEKAFLILEDTVSLLEKTMAITKTELSSHSPWLADIVWTAEEYDSVFGGSALLGEEKERAIYIHNEDVCYVIYPSLYYGLLTAREDKRWYTRFCYCLDPIREDVRYRALVERVRVLIEIRSK